MVNKVKVLIGDDSVEYGIACASTLRDRKSTRLNSSHYQQSRMPYH